METTLLPSNAPIVASFRMSLQELLQSSQLSLRHSPLGRKFRTRFFVGPLAIILGTAILTIHGLRMIYIGGLFILLGIMASLSPLLQRRALQKHYSERPDRDMMVKWEFYPDRILTATEGTSGQFQWRMFPRVIETRAGFLFYLNDRMFHWIPAHAFANSEDAGKLSRLVQSSVGDFKKVD